MGLIKYFSEWEKTGDWERIHLVFKRSVTVLFLIGIVLAILVISLSRSVSATILDSDKYYLFVLLIAISFPFSLSSAVFESYLKGLKKFGNLVYVSVFASIFSVILTALFAIYMGLYGAVIATMLNSVVLFVIYIVILNKNKLIKLRIKPKIHIKKEMGLIFSIGIASLIAGAAENSSLLFIRSMVVRFLGVESNGIYQSVASISNNYLNLFFLTLLAYALPILSEIKSPDLMNLELNSILRFTVLFIVPVIAVTFVFREILILIFFSRKFISAGDLFLFSFIGDFFKALTWVFGAWLIPASRVKLWTIIAVLYHLLYFTIFYVFIQQNIGLYSVVLSYMLTNILICIVNFYFLYKLNSFRIQRNNGIAIVVSMLFLSLIMLSSELNTTLGYILVVPLSILWLKISVKKKEYIELYAMIKNRWK